MKHIIILLACLVISAAVTFYDWLPFFDGGLFKLTKLAPWLFEFPVYLGLLFAPKGVQGVSPVGFGLGFFLQLTVVVYGGWFLVLMITKRVMCDGPE